MQRGIRFCHSERGDPHRLHSEVSEESTRLPARSVAPPRMALKFLMLRFLCLSTSLIFAVHAVLGCSIHHACAHSHTIAAHDAFAHEEYDCAGHDHDDAAPADESECPSHSCQHVTCSYVKAETVQLDGSGTQSPAPAIAADETVKPARVFQAIIAADVRLQFSSTPLYVWQCALLI